jgi:hypothetical protein
MVFYSKTCSVIYCVESEGGLLGKLRSLTNERELSGRKGEKGGKEGKASPLGERKTLGHFRK